MPKDMDFCHSWEIYLTTTEKKSLNTTTKTGRDALKAVSKKVVHKAAEATGKFKGNKLRIKL